MSKTVTMPDDVWGELATIADDQGCTIADLIVAGVNNIRNVKPARAQAVLDLVRVGYTDRQVAETTGELVSYVADVRRRAGLRPNRARTPRPYEYRRFTRQEDAEIRRLHMAGCSPAQIGAELAARPETIHTKLARWGLNPKENTP